MNKIVSELTQVIILILAVIGLLWLIGRLLDPRTYALALSPQSPPFVNVTINMPEQKQKELTAGEHVKGLGKIAFNKFVEKVAGWTLSWF